jgi:hypothetical protein
MHLLFSFSVRMVFRFCSASSYFCFHLSTSGLFIGILEGDGGGDCVKELEFTLFMEFFRSGMFELPLVSLFGADLLPFAKLLMMKWLFWKKKYCCN